MLSLTEAKRLLKHNIAIDVNGCWIWQLGRQGLYGKVPLRLVRAVGARSERAHVLAFTLWFGDIADGKFVCHFVMCLSAAIQNIYGKVRRWRITKILGVKIDM